MAVRTISSFKAQLAGGGARANMFSVNLNWPGLLTEAQQPSTANAAFLISATNLPGMTIGEVAVPFRGRNLYLAGDRTFEAWTITVLNDIGFTIRNAFEIWMNGINSMSDNTGAEDPGDYQVQTSVSQLDKAGDFVKTYNFKGMWPTTLSNIDVSAETNDAVETFEVTLRYDYFEAATVAADGTTETAITD